MALSDTASVLNRVLISDVEVDNINLRGCSSFPREPSYDNTYEKLGDVYITDFPYQIKCSLNRTESKAL